MAKQRSHNEWFRTVSLGGRKSCPTCGEKLEAGEHIWSWGEYVVGKWRTVKHFCKKCYDKEVRTPLVAHTDDCGCTVELQGRGEKLPEWLTLETCKYCGGNCPNNEEYMCDGFAGDIDNLYSEESCNV